MLGFTLSRGTVKKCVSFSQVITVYAADKYTLATVIGELSPFYISGVPSLRSVENELVKSNFVRVSRSHFVNKRHIKSLELLILDTTHTRLLAVMCDRSKVAISRRYQTGIKALFKGEAA